MSEKTPLPRVGSPFRIDGGASTRTLHARTWYGGKKGRAAQLGRARSKKRIARSEYGRSLFTWAHGGLVDLEPDHRVFRHVVGGAT